MCYKNSITEIEFHWKFVEKRMFPKRVVRQMLLHVKAQSQVLIAALNTVTKQLIWLYSICGPDSGVIFLAITCVSNISSQIVSFVRR